ncbi:MAG: MFS transporter [Actinobacteria bacterium]|nr:MFS transporter [Actinomycetota bacterium]
MSDGEPGSTFEDAPRRGPLARARSHLVDLTPLRGSRDFRLLFTSKAISDLGDEIVAVAVPFQVYALTRSTLAVGLLGLCELAPVFVLPIIGGAAADAIERRRLVIRTHAVMALMSALMAVNAFLPHPRLWPLYVFATISAGLYTFNRPAVSTWPARLLPRELLPSGFALEASFGTLAGLVGPVVAGVLLATIRTGGVFVFDVVTFLVVIASVSRMRPSPPSEEAPPFGFEAIRDGLGFLKGKRVIQSVFAADLNAMVFGFPMALFPAIAIRMHGGPQTLGLLYAAPAAGSFLATMLSGRAKHVRRQGRAILVSVAIWGAAIAAFGFTTSLWLALAMLAIAGAGDMVSGIFRMSMLQSVVDDSMRGRLDGVAMAVWATGPALGNVESGVVATLTSVQFSVVSGGILCVLGAGLIRLLLPQIGRYDARHPAP